MTETLWYLKQCDLLRRIAPEQLARAEASCRAREFARGQPIYMPSDAASGVLLLARGRAKIASFSDDGKQTILAFIEPGELFGELALLDGGPRDEYAEAVEKSLAIFMPVEVLHRLLETSPTASLGVTKLIGLRRRRIERRLKYLLFRPNKERLVSLLLELAEQYGEQTPEGVRLRIKLSHQDLASIIGSTRETVTLLLNELQGAGMLRIGRKKVLLTDLAGLAASVHSSEPKLPESALR